MPPIRFRLRTMMIAVAVAAAVMGVVRFAREYRFEFAVLVATLVLFSPTICLLLIPFAVDRLAEMRSRVMSKSTPADEGLSRNERPGVCR